MKNPLKYFWKEIKAIIEPDEVAEILRRRTLAKGGINPDLNPSSMAPPLPLGDLAAQQIIDDAEKRLIELNVNPGTWDNFTHVPIP